MLIYSRDTLQSVKAPDPDGRLLRFLYRSAIGRGLLSLALQRGVLRIVGKLADCPLSRPAIDPFAKKRNIPLRREYRSFNDFFAREPNTAFQLVDNAFLSPCEAYCAAWQSTNDATPLMVKGVFTFLDALAGEDTSRFSGGALYQFSLTTSHLHRVCAFDDCRLLSQKSIPGAYHSTHPSVSGNGKNVYTENHRLVQVLETNRFGTALVVCISSMLVGSVIGTAELGTRFRPGETLSRFALGGSAVVIVFEKGRIRPAEDLLQITRQRGAAYVAIGDSIGRPG